MEKYQDLLKKPQAKKAILLLGILAIGIIIIIFIFISLRTKMVSEQSKHGPDDDDNKPAIYFENRYLLDYTIGKIHDSELLTNIEEFVLEESNTAPEKNTPKKGLADNVITGTIEEDGFKKLNNQPKYTYRFSFNTSDGRNYIIYARTDENYGKYYLITIIDRTDKNASSDRIYINTNDENTYKTDLLNWSNTFKLNDPKVIIKSLAEDN